MAMIRSGERFTHVDPMSQRCLELNMIIYINFDLNFVALLESLDPFGMASVWSNSNTGKHEKHIQRDHLTHQDASRVGCNFARDTALGTSWRI